MNKLSLKLILTLGLFFLLGSGFAQASDLSFKILSAEVARDVETDLFGGMGSAGVLLEIEVTNRGSEVKLWPADFAIGITDQQEEFRISGYLMTNVVSDREDDMTFRLFQGSTVRKGTRYFKVFFSEFMNWQLLSSLDFSEAEAGVLYYRMPISQSFSIVPLPEDFED